MRAFAITIFILLVMRAIVCLVHLSSEHPRQEKPVHVGIDAGRLILTLALLAWAAYVTWGVE